MLTNSTPSCLTVLFWIMVLVNLISDVFALKCVQCNSLNSQECVQGGVIAMECSDPKHKYCISYSGMLKKDEGLFIVIRDCSEHNMSNLCHTVNVQGIKNNGTKDHVQVCYAACKRDGCNNNDMSDHLRQQMNEWRNSRAVSGNVRNYLALFVGAAILAALL